jgi:hypothetical protein
MNKTRMIIGIALVLLCITLTGCYVTDEEYAASDEDKLFVPTRHTIVKIEPLNPVFDAQFDCRDREYFDDINGSDHNRQKFNVTLFEFFGNGKLVQMTEVFPEGNTVEFRRYYHENIWYWKDTPSEAIRTEMNQAKANFTTDYVRCIIVNRFDYRVEYWDEGVMISNETTSCDFYGYRINCKFNEPKWECNYPTTLVETESVESHITDCFKEVID